MNNIELRDYQKRQVDFIENKIQGKLPLAIQSPTGSGKSFVMMKVAKDKLDEMQGAQYNVVISTGFNNLVYQMAEDAEKFGIKPLIWMGKGHIQCGLKVQKETGVFPTLNTHQAFTKEKKYQITNYDCLNDAPCAGKCLYNKAKQKLNNGSNLVITNHTSYLLALKMYLFKPNLVMIDESHTFANFYDSLLSTEISFNEIKMIKSALEYGGRSPINSLFNRALENNLRMAPGLVKNIYEKISKFDYIEKDLISRLKVFESTSPAIDNYIEINNNGMSLTKFWTKFDVHQDEIVYVLVSATQDDFTLRMFGVPKSRIYIENIKTVDYSKSKLVVVNKNEFKDGIDVFMRKIKEEDRKSGLILSTTNEDVRYVKSFDDFYGYKVFTNINEFENYNGYKVLTGSRALFQGVDIPGLDFVCLNKIPFATYDEKFQARSSYFKAVTKMDTWKEFTIPLVQNDITQSIGRLWRKSSDKGVVAIMDPRLLDKFSFLKDYILNTRKGIGFDVWE